MRTLVVENGDAEGEALYQDALGHIQRSYRATFGAEGEARPARLVVTLAPNGEISCAAGIRRSDEGFFSQQYLDTPVGELIGRISGRAVDPSEILEVGALACATPFAAYPTLRAVFDWGRARGICWGLFTATDDVRRLIRRARISPILLAQADAARVSDPVQWGSYYTHDPWVCAFRDPEQSVGADLSRAEMA
ncbi:MULTISPECIES: thermostable hemolysin [Shimia]|uniref:thermostable hemolysin n=1 Tax=Shimia TaxID=573139 RepID=UPI001FB1DD68|nr:MULTISPECIES: thermostable hemolysin [Shimia]MDV4146119.1 thermostable hemolysin [Shimia sp. FJ5]